MRSVLVVLFLCFPFLLFAQQGFVSAGGEISGEGGSMSFSVGQSDFFSLSDGSITISYGLQQVFFFFIDPEVPVENPLQNLVLSAGQSTCYDATQTITTAGGGTYFTVEAGATVSLVAGQRVLMLPGTNVKSGGYLHAYITNTGAFCGEPEKHFLSEEPFEIMAESPLEHLLEVAQDALFKVYPNPTTGSFTLEIRGHDLSSGVLVEVYGMRGDRILRQELPPLQQSAVFSLDGQTPGIYIVRVISGTTLGVERIIKR